METTDWESKRRTTELEREIDRLGGGSEKDHNLSHKLERLLSEHNQDMKFSIEEVIEKVELKHEEKVGALEKCVENAFDLVSDASSFLKKLRENPAHEALLSESDRKEIERIMEDLDAIDLTMKEVMAEEQAEEQRLADHRSGP